MAVPGFLLIVLLAGSTAAGNPGAAAQQHLGSGNKLMQMERFKEASQQFELALHDDPTLSEARRQLVVCYFELREYEPARRLCGEMLAAKESPQLATYYMGRIDLVEQNFDSAIRRFRALGQSEPVRDELYYLGVAYFKQGKYPNAVEILRKAVAHNPRDYRVHQFLARSYQKLGQTKNAEQEFSETRRLHDYYLQGTVAIGECRSLLLGGQPEKAWESCRPLLETDDVDKLVSIGMLFGKAEKYEQALAVWDKAVALDPESPEINYNLALTCFHLKNMPRARKHVATAVQLRPDFFEANLLYGTILYHPLHDGRR
jgi:tetratricopeptide (TPR) repeat protein